MKVLGLALLFALAASITPVAAQVAPRLAKTLPAPELATLEKIRREVWVHWFSGDTAALKRVLVPELVAISPDAGHWQSLDASLAGAARFKAGGGKLVSVDFSETDLHRFGDVVVMFSHYKVVTERGESRSTQEGRATEVFVLAGGRWLHTSWHLDVM